MAFDTRRGKATFAWTFAADTELTGPMAVRLHIEVRGMNDVFLFAGVRKMRGRRHVGFEGSYGFGGDLVTHGMCKASMRRTDPDHSYPWMPWHPFADPQTLAPGEIVPVDIELLPSATLFRAGETLRLDVQGHWFWPRNPLLGQFPAAYEPSPSGTVVLHTGGSHDASLLLPVVPPRA
ncbi:MAG: CocE/NonD family hydrolase [Actinomycetota bacterium]